MIDASRLRARIDRLDELARGLDKEEIRWKGGWWGAIVAVEQRQYVATLRKVREALGEARHALVRAARTLEEFHRLPCRPPE